MSKGIARWFHRLNLLVVGPRLPNVNGVKKLADEYPWPETKPDAPVSTWGWGMDGEELVRQHLPRDAQVIVEIGTLLGSSARFLADHCPDAHLFCVDPWFDVTDPADRPFLEHAPELTDFVTKQTDGIYQVFLASNWELRHRLTPLRGFSPDMLAPIHAHGIEVDAVYIDGSHVYEDVLADVIATAMMFPAAMMCGDDWNWPGVQHALNYVAANRGREIITSDNTWLLKQTGEDTRHSALSARTVGPVEHSAPVRVAKRLLQK